MSALPAEITELTPGPAAVQPPVGAQVRTARRAELAEARRARLRWSVLSVAILGSFFGLTIGVLDVLH
jgi:hypothetical protein